jgi:glutamate synthase domain-containing protein 2
MSEIETAASAMSSLSTAESKGEGGRTQEERDAKKAAKVDRLTISRHGQMPDPSLSSDRLLKRLPRRPRRQPRQP